LTPTAAPTDNPTLTPTAAPTDYPTLTPTVAPAYPTSTPTVAPVTVGNDPMMKVGDKFVKFSLTPGVLSPLLSWKAQLTPSEDVKMELLGLTFTAFKTCAKTTNCGDHSTLVAGLAQKLEQARVMAKAKIEQATMLRASSVPFAAPGMNNLTVHDAASEVIALAFLSPGEDPQWFGQLALKADEKTVLSVSRGQGGFGKMLVKVDGRTLVQEGAGEVVSERSGLRVSLVRSKRHDWKAANVHSQVLSIEAPGFKFSVESAPGMKYLEVAKQIKYAHLNLKFDQDAFPKFSNGFLAQLAGVRSLTERSEARFDMGKTHSSQTRAAKKGLFDDPNREDVDEVEDGRTSVFVKFAKVVDNV